MKLKIEDGVSEIPASKYAGNAEIESVFIPSSVVKIGAKAFMECKKLCDVEFEDKGTELELGESAFEGCSLLRKLELPARPLRILGRCFKDSGLVDISIVSGCGLLRDSFLFQGCPAEVRLREIIEEEVSAQADRMFGRRHPEHDFPRNAVLERLRNGRGCGMSAIKEGVGELFKRMVDDTSFPIRQYSEQYKNSCAQFDSVVDWRSLDKEQMARFVKGDVAIHVANIYPDTISRGEWDCVNLERLQKVFDGVRNIVKEDLSTKAKSIGDEFVSLFKRRNHWAAFYRLVAMAKPELVVQIPGSDKLHPLYEWMTGCKMPTIEKAEWCQISHAVRDKLDEALPDQDKYITGAFAWYLANAFRGNPTGDDVIRKEKTLAWMREFGLIE